MSLVHLRSRRGLIASVAAAIVLATVGPVRSDGSPAIWGTLFHRESGGQTYTQAGDRVLLYAASSGWIGPNYTNDAGVYAIYGIASGTYSLHVFVNRKDVFSRTVTSTGRQDPITGSGCLGTRRWGGSRSS